MLITSIHKLPLENFIDCIVDEDYSSLVISGEHQKAEIEMVWQDILSQYNDAMNDDGNKQYVFAYRDYENSKKKYFLVAKYIELLNWMYVPKWAAELNRLVRANFAFNPHNLDEYHEMLRNCNNRNQANFMHMELARIRIEELVKVQNKDSNVKPDRKYFTSVMINLKDFKEREIPYTISTYEFCLLVNRYSEYLKTQNARS